MSLQEFQAWISTADLKTVALLLFGAMCLSGLVGAVLQRLRRARQDGAAEGEGKEGYIVSSVFGLLALLMGFTFSMAVDRFEGRRVLVLNEANAIGTTYLRAQLLEEPHRSRMTDLLLRYTDQRIALAKAKPAEAAVLIKANDQIITDIWTATSAAYPTIRQFDFSSTYLDSVNNLIDLDASRKAARGARVPPAVFAVLFIYLVIAAAVIMSVLNGWRQRVGGVFLFVLITLSLVLIIDIDRPTIGRVNESQAPMEQLQKTLAANPPAVFDRWRAVADLPALSRPAQPGE